LTSIDSDILKDLENLPAFSKLVREIPHFYALVDELWGLAAFIPGLLDLSEPEKSLKVASELAALQTPEDLALKVQKKPHQVAAQLKELWLNTRHIGLSFNAFMALVTKTDLATLLPLQTGGVTVIDLRTEDDHPVGAGWKNWINYKTAFFLEIMPQIADSTQVIVVCETGRKSLSGALYLLKHKPIYSWSCDVRYVEGGISQSMISPQNAPT
jgi:rhodanese-related sulfurtransferase